MTAITSGLAPSLRALQAVVFDTDGVITDSARLHAAAWKAAFDAFLRAHPPEDPALGGPFDMDVDYRRHVDGKSRIDGAAAFLASRRITLPLGRPGDPPGDGSVWAIAARKERLFNTELRRQSVDSWPGTVRLLHALYEERVPCAAVSASRHTRELLAKAGVLGLLRTVVDGNEAARLALPGKPDPALFLEAAARLSRPARDTAVVEDALAGVEAGRRGGFGLVVGVDRTAGSGSAADLLAHGADVVVRDLSELMAAPRSGGSRP
jgi:HAD superfamily hydrolase (TIGR01509 family)